jgi:hypothetical protein
MATFRLAVLVATVLPRGRVEVLAMAPASGLGGLPTYEKWLSTRGIVNGGVEQAFFIYPGVPNGGQVQGLGLGKGAGSALLTVPRSASLRTTERDSSKSPLPEVSDSVWMQEKILTRLSLLLLAEWKKGRASQFAEYIEMLVDLDPPFTPLHWDAASLSVLKSAYPSMAAAVEQQSRDYKRLFDLLPLYRQQGAPVSFDRFVWAMEAVRSRTFQGFGAIEERDSDGDERWLWTCVLLPAIDMVNHHSQRANCNVAYNSALSAFVLSRSENERELAEGEEVLISYGDRDNDDLLQHFGFVEPSNPHDLFRQPLSDGSSTLTVTKRGRETWTVPENVGDDEIKRVLTAQLALLSSPPASASINPLLGAFLEEKRCVLQQALGLL